MNKNEVLFHSPFCKFNDVDEALFYIRSQFDIRKELVQINLDNCTIQRMEKLDQNSTIDDVKKLGLYSSYRILNESQNVLLCPFGVYEMPGVNISKAIDSYELFCRKFWPLHVNDKNATSLRYNKNQTEVNFQDLSEEEKHNYGPWYLAYLLIQQILHLNKRDSPISKFNNYIHGVIYYLDMISAFELEVAKYAFWDISDKEFHNLPIEIINRRKFLKKNFTKTSNSLEKTKKSCMNAAMDTFWLRANQCLSIRKNHENLGVGYKVSEYWLATTDKKLYNSANDIKSISSPLGFGHFIEIFREDELRNMEYWRKVDSISDNILMDRIINKNNSHEEKMKNISNSVREIEKNLENYFSTYI